MDLINALILGLVQGLTEFLPISSSAHIRVVGEFLGTGSDPGAAFTAITQLGTETAVLLYFWRDITSIIKNWSLALVGKLPQSDPKARMGWLVIVGSIPIVVLGLIFQDQIETFLRSLWIISATLIGFGILLGIADWIGSKRRRLDSLTWGHGIIYGFAQSLALIPGVSRSGGTITAGLLMGYSREAAARYSFLLAIPAVFGSGIYQAVKAYGGICTGGTTGCVAEVFGPLETIAATVVAFVVGFAVIAFFMSYISKHSFLPFVIYRILLGGTIIALLLTGVLEA